MNQTDLLMFYAMSISTCEVWLCYLTALPPSPERSNKLEWVRKRRAEFYREMREVERL